MHQENKGQVSIGFLKMALLLPWSLQLQAADKTVIATVVCGILLFYPNTVMNILAVVAIAVLARIRLEISREAVAKAMANEAVIK
ncbi:MAG TPA: hypothetical protein DDY32_08530 [Desulfobulbaceae bacterium]|nr:hypothetical protein [Desulfobulbaceae bacterium]